MPIALLAGLPSRYLQRVKDVIGSAVELAEWEFAYLPSPRGPSLQVRERKLINGEAEKHGSLHVLGFSAERNRDQVASEIRPYFRFRWFDHALLAILDTPYPAQFVAALASVLEQENEWAQRIKPSTDSDALLLPERCFRCSVAHSDMWLKSEAYGSEDSVPAAEKAIAAFAQKYHQRIQFQTYGHPPRLQTKWMDDRRLVFDENGARHGIAPPPRAWKYSYRIEDGFHFDVSKVNRDAFKIADIEGREHNIQANGYLNMEVHGFAW
ncbi:MAG TPA: hypothetical protein VHX60_01450 [Acidobacteriaceae bacterium]|jgi:hypothetical protein|nr:hypothetical protein [Acidobacteriaceae bacterium]